MSSATGSKATNNEHRDDLDGTAVKPPQTTTHLDRYTRQGYRPSRPEPVDHDALYRSLMEGVQDKSILEKSPQVLEYERRNNIKHEGYKSETIEKNALMSSQAMGSVCEPAPPTDPKPEVHPWIQQKSTKINYMPVLSLIRIFPPTTRQSHITNPSPPTQKLRSTTMVTPVDAVFEDIYDFDDINGISFEAPRSGKTYTADDYGDIVRPTYKPRVTDDRVRLPPIVVGNALCPHPPTASHGTDHRHEKSSVELGHTDIDRHKGRKMPYVQKQPQKEHNISLEGPATKTPQTTAYLDRYTRPGYCTSRPEPVDHDVLYRSLMEGVQDKSMLEKSPQVLEYERRNNIKHEGCKSGITEKNSDTSSYADSVLTRRESVYQPAPPTAPKPETQHGYNRNRQRLLHASVQLDQDVSVRSPPKPYHKPRPPTAEVETDYDGDIQEALRVERELDRLHKALEKQRKANLPYGMEILPPTTAAAANSNLPGCSTPCLIPTAAVPYKSAEHVKTWNGDTAKRGLGFRSKIKREQQEKRKLSINLIPEKIRKEMKKYFG
ncbi:uncharacterized protein LOC123550145 [Mercenaria mercenaria]|uniref:uncharacterized protein LOC123550145 n=1 Tax=Mercenaria mercenaria TaxID=6596 RepID=UPI00234F0ADD|nr:uncharacterized protein LOC123550145 [Mercenaria mercenaria]